MSVIQYIYLAVGTGMLGMVITFAVIFASQYFGLDILKNVWLLAIPLVLSLFLNVLFIELFRRYKKK